MKYNHDNDFMECQQTPMLFTGEIKGIQDVMKMMYRGEVNIRKSKDNYEVQCGIRLRCPGDVRNM